MLCLSQSFMLLATAVHSTSDSCKQHGAHPGQCPAAPSNSTAVAQQQGVVCVGTGLLTCQKQQDHLPCPCPSPDELTPAGPCRSSAVASPSAAAAARVAAPSCPLLGPRWQPAAVGGCADQHQAHGQQTILIRHTMCRQHNAFSVNSTPVKKAPATSWTSLPTCATRGSSPLCASAATSPNLHMRSPTCARPRWGQQGIGVWGRG